MYWQVACVHHFSNCLGCSDVCIYQSWQQVGQITWNCNSIFPLDVYIDPYICIHVYPFFTFSIRAHSKTDESMLHWSQKKSMIIFKRDLSSPKVGRLWKDANDNPVISDEQGFHQIWDNKIWDGEEFLQLVKLPCPWSTEVWPWLQSRLVVVLLLQIIIITVVFVTLLQNIAAE